MLTRKFLLFTVLVALVLQGLACQAVENELRMVAVGDILLARGVDKKIERYGINYPFQKTKRLMRESDIIFGNLESPLTNKGFPLNKKYIFRAKPEHVKALSFGGFNLLSLANNHTLDYGRKGLMQTMEVLSKNGIAFMGAGSNYNMARKETVVYKKGMRVAFLAINFFPNEQLAFIRNKPTVAYFDFDGLNESISQARKNADFVVLSFHWGVEFSSLPTSEQRKIAKFSIDNGADMIIGHHPHVFQGIETYKNKVIAYSLGNFLFDQNVKWAKESIMLQCKFSKNKISDFKILPVIIENSQPKIVRGIKAKNILNKVTNLSMNLGTNLQQNDDFIRVLP